MKRYTRNVHRPDGDAKYYNNFIVVRTTEKYFNNPTGAHADLSRRELLYKNFEDAVSEYLKQCERSWQDCRYADGHNQDVTFVHVVALQGVSGYDENDTPLPDTFRTARYRYEPNE